MNISQIFGVLAIVLLVLFLLFLVIRELQCWYWKINKRLHVQKEILRALSIINENISSFMKSSGESPKTFSERDFDDSFTSSISHQTVTCPKCGKESPINSTACENCGHLRKSK